MVFEEKHHMLWAYEAYEAHEAYEEKSQIHRKNVALGNVGGIIVCGRWTRSARPRGLGGNFDFSPLNPLGTP